jgi:hypothetical protein
MVGFGCVVFFSVFSFFDPGRKQEKERNLGKFQIRKKVQNENQKGVFSKKLSIDGTFLFRQNSGLPER